MHARAHSRVRIALLSVIALALAGCSVPRWPVDGTMTSPYGLRFLGYRPDIHNGVDIVAPLGTPVRAMKRGKVSFAGVQGGYGNVVYIDHGAGVTSLYAHLSEILVRTGERVSGRDEIGRVGASGNAAGTHLHFEVWVYGRVADPVPLLGRHPRPD